MKCIRDMSFGALLKRLRLKNKETLRAYCKRTGFCPGNISKLERNLLAPPCSRDNIMRYVNGLEYTDVELNLLFTASQNHYIAKVIARF